MDFRLLGPLEVRGLDGLLRIRSAKERALLGLLLLRANQFVSCDLLIDELWGEHPPTTAKHTLEVHVSRLRRALAVGGNGSMIESFPGGYRVRVAEDALDVLRFERLLKEGRSELDAGALETAEQRLEAALALWRGPALADLADEPFSEVEAQRLEELRLAALEARLEVALRLGRHAELVGELQSQVADHPHHERLRAQLMLALYRSGRQADALATYREGRRRLVDELGIEPSRELQELEQGILRQDPTLELRPTAAKSPATSVADRLGAPAHSTAAVAELRQVVTAMFCEATGAMAPDEQLDPEALKVPLDAFFGRVKATVESHGGTMGGGIGRAMMAVFGVPVAHEDDALRACRAAMDIRPGLPELGLQACIGVSSGEAVADDSARLAIGEAVDVAARLQQAAEVGEVLISNATLELAHGSVEVEPVATLMLANHEPVPAYRLLSVAEIEVSGPETATSNGRPAKLPCQRSLFGSATRTDALASGTLGPGGSDHAGRGSESSKPGIEPGASSQSAIERA